MAQGPVQLKEMYDDLMTDGSVRMVIWMIFHNVDSVQQTFWSKQLLIPHDKFINYFLKR